MRSLLDSPRLALEWTLRTLAVALLAWAIVESLATRRVHAAEEIAGSALGNALPRLAVMPPGAGVLLALDTLPGPVTRDWLVALRRAGMPVRWSAATSARPLAVAAEPAVDPRRSAIIRVAAPAGSTVLLGDETGTLDSARVEWQGVAVSAPALGGAADARVERQHARARFADSLRLRPVLVLASAGWEGKFVVTALEEAGWTVEARLAVAPGAEVRQGELGAIDTARYSAVVVLDSSARMRASALARYARSGGGLLVAGGAARLAELRGVLPGQLAAARAPSPREIDDSVTLARLPLAPIDRLRDDAVIVARQGGLATTAVRRVHAGRVALTGYGESWRWRMSGGAEGARAHRLWWSHLVSIVAYAPGLPLETSPGGSRAALDDDLEAAPLARLIGALGPPTSPARGPSAEMFTSWRRSGVPWWMSVIVLLALLAEWSSRRLRGAR